MKPIRKIQKYFLAFGTVTALVLTLGSFGAPLQAAAEPPEADQDGGALSDEEVRWQAAIQNIQDAIDEDPEEAAMFLGSTPIQGLDLEELEALSERATQFMQLKRIERLQQQQAERRRLREIQEVQRTARQ